MSAERTRCAERAQGARGAEWGRGKAWNSGGKRFAAPIDVYSYGTFPVRTALARTLVPSTIAHALLLLWLALVLTSRGPDLEELYAVELEQVAPRPAPTAVAPTPEPATAPAPGNAAAAGGEVIAPASDRAGMGGVAAGDGRPPAYVPPAAQAGRVLTAPDTGAASGDDALDFSVVQGRSEHYAGGVTSARGTSKAAVYDARARDEGVAGVPGGTGTGNGVPAQAAAPQVVAPAPRVDRSRPALPVTTSWSCPFPAEAGIDFARARVIVTVGIDGRARGATVLVDPGHGFGAAARSCVLSQRYSVALDADGQPRVATTAPITVTFTR